MLPVIFDLDGTLIDSLPNITDAANALLHSEGLLPVTTELTFGFVGYGERVFLERLIAATGLDGSQFDRLMAAFIPFYELAARDTRMIPGAGMAVAEFRRRGIKIGLCTNKPRAPLLPTLHAAGLEHSFDVIVAGDDLTKRKPDPEPLLHGIKQLGAESCIYVGDSEVDGETAVRAGVPFALYTEGIRTVPVEDIIYRLKFSDYSVLLDGYEDICGQF